MGKAHSNAYSQAGHFYDLPYRIRRRLLCGRRRDALAAHGGSVGLGRDVHRLALGDRADGHRRGRHLAAEPSARAGGDRRGAGRQDHPLREAAGDVARRSESDGRRRARRADDGVVQLPACSGDCLCAPADRRGPAGHDLPLRRRLPAAVGRRSLARRDVADGSGAGRVGRGRRPADAPARHGAVPERPDPRGHGHHPDVRARTGRWTMRSWRW